RREDRDPDEEHLVDLVRERLQPLIDVLVRAEIFLVFGATLDVLRSEEQQKAEQARIHLPAEG
ncbi:MAG: hypothetical protein ACE5HB_09165, partial [Terriglobia bacterium]